jgi:hypothetical protein
MCNRGGGHLASFTSLVEQAEVEQFYIKRSDLVGSFHQSYWIGLQYDNVSETWSWNDFRSYDPATSYTHWGTTVPDYVPEPSKNASCSVANASEAFERPSAWGWSDGDCSMLFPFICRKAAPDAYVYVSNTTSATYILNTSMLDFASASQTCNDIGGNLVYYSTVEEQLEVEQHFASRRELLAEYNHGFYWIGYRAQGNPAFDWVDPQALGIEYSHWGTYMPLGQPEPNNLMAPENCAGANATETLPDGAFGWSDEACSIKAQFICKVLRECHDTDPAAVPAAPAFGHVQHNFSLATSPAVSPPCLCHPPVCAACIAHPAPSPMPNPALLPACSCHRCLHLQRQHQRHLPVVPDAHGACRSTGDLQCTRRPPGHLHQPGRAGGGGAVLRQAGLHVPHLHSQLLDWPALQ